MRRVNDMKEKILDILCEISGEELDDIELDLFSEGIVDSFIIINLVVELEKAFDISIDIDAITFENFCTVKAIMEMVKKLCGNFE